MLNDIPQERLDELHLAPRKSLDGTKVIMKDIHYDLLFPPPATKARSRIAERVYPYPVYSSEEITEILSGDDCTAKETEE